MPGGTLLIRVFLARHTGVDRRPRLFHASTAGLIGACGTGLRAHAKYPYICSLNFFMRHLARACPACRRSIRQYGPEERGIVIGRSMLGINAKE